MKLKDASIPETIWALITNKKHIEIISLFENVSNFFSSLELID